MPRIQIRGDVVGGVTAAILTIPASIGYGVLSFHALGDQYVSHAILAGLFGATIVPLAALALGNRGPTIYAPRSILALLLGSVVLQTIIPAGAKSGGWSVGQTLSALFLVILLAGVFQALFGVLGVGTLIKYIPAPVMAGFQNAVAFLILIAQIGTLTGVPSSLSPAQLGAYLAGVPRPRPRGAPPRPSSARISRPCSRSASPSASGRRSWSGGHEDSRRACPRVTRGRLRA